MGAWVIFPTLTAILIQLTGLPLSLARPVPRSPRSPRSPRWLAGWLAGSLAGWLARSLIPLLARSLARFLAPSRTLTLTPAMSLQDQRMRELNHQLEEKEEPHLGHILRLNLSSNLNKIPSQCWILSPDPEPEPNYKPEPA